MKWSMCPSHYEMCLWRHMSDKERDRARRRWIAELARAKLAGDPHMDVMRGAVKFYSDLLRYYPGPENLGGKDG